MLNFKTNFLDLPQAKSLIDKHGSPLFVYSESVLARQAKEMLSVPAPFSLTIRYAMKANSFPGILEFFKIQNFFKL